jgi:hypothetical protein
MTPGSCSQTPPRGEADGGVGQEFLDAGERTPLAALTDAVPGPTTSTILGIHVIAGRTMIVALPKSTPLFESEPGPGDGERTR